MTNPKSLALAVILALLIAPTTRAAEPSTKPTTRTVELPIIKSFKGGPPKGLVPAELVRLPAGKIVLKDKDGHDREHGRWAAHNPAGHAGRRQAAHHRQHERDGATRSAGTRQSEYRENRFFHLLPSGLCREHSRTLTLEPQVA